MVAHMESDKIVAGTSPTIKRSRLTFSSFRPMGMVGEACLPSNAYYLRTPGYTLYSGVHVCWSEHSDPPFVCGFMSLDYGLGTNRNYFKGIAKLNFHCIRQAEPMTPVILFRYLRCYKS